MLAHDIAGAELKLGLLAPLKGAQQAEGFGAARAAEMPSKRKTLLPAGP